MQSYVMLTRLAPGSLRSPRSLEELERQVMHHIRAECPKVEWSGSYAIMGPYDYVDLFRAPDIDTAMRVSALVRTFGHAHTEIWAAAEWDDFKKLIRDLPVNAGSAKAASD